MAAACHRNSEWYKRFAYLAYWSNGFLLKSYAWIQHWLYMYLRQYVNYDWLDQNLYLDLWQFLLLNLWLHFWLHSTENCGVTPLVFITRNELFPKKSVRYLVKHWLGNSNRFANILRSYKRQSVIPMNLAPWVVQRSFLKVVPAPACMAL